MGKIFLLATLLLMMVSCVFASNLTSSTNESNSNETQVQANTSAENKSEDRISVEVTFQNESDEARPKRNVTYLEGVKMKGNDGAGKGNVQARIRSNFSSSLNLTYQLNETTNETVVNAVMSNGKNAQIKVMPETASQRALEVLSMHCEINNCTIELKEVGSGNQTKLAYEIEETEPVKIFGLFKANLDVHAQVDAETGEVVQTSKPWWSFLATKQKK